MPPDIEQAEYVEFAAVGGLDAVPTSVRGAWKGLDYVAWNKMGPRVGENRAIPGVTGRLAVPREIDRAEDLAADADHRQARHRRHAFTDPFEGVLVNLDYLIDNVLSYTPERAVTYHRRDGSTKTGSVTVDDWDSTVDANSAGDVHLLVVQITIAAGYLTPIGS
jgi:hypothetical protein